ncbi:MAG: hypothetical protein JSV04_12505 [Candidatus Heimdallarchaeota archaeon]|nr:MAG: hypothetical protein JSV04_12505 [Candidatus Heimdallarchaeota archaeon]
MRHIYFVIILSIFMISCDVENRNLPTMAQIRGSILNESESGSFFLENTTEGIKILEWFEILKLGTTWNLTIHVHANSSSAVNITMIRYMVTDPSGWLSGPITFLVFPNETRSESYVSHFACDAVPSYSFQCSPENSLEIASGTYNFQKTHKGYSVDHGTDCSSIGNITAWLEGESTTSSSKQETTSTETQMSSQVEPTTRSTSQSISSGISTSMTLLEVISMVIILLLIKEKKTKKLN